MWSDKYEEKLFFQTMRHIPNRGLAVDAGAHVGIWTRKLAQLFSNVIAFEPVPEHAECWRANTEIFDNVMLHEFALSNCTSSVKMKQAKYNSGTSSLEYKTSQLRTSNEIEIVTRPLDSFDLPQVNFIKIDVEGHEVSMLEGAESTIDNYSPSIFIEIHKQELKKDNNAYDWLTVRGYKVIAELASSNYLFAK